MNKCRNQDLQDERINKIEKDNFGNIKEN